MKGLILAGGFGTRLGPIGQEKPKALLMIEDDTSLNHLIGRLEDVEVEWSILANRKFADSFEQYGNVLIEETRADEEKPGAVSAIWQFIDGQKINEDLFVLASDNYFASGFGDMLDCYSGKPMIGVSYIGSIPELDPREMGTLGFEGCEQYPPPERSFRITEFKEKSPEPASEYVGTGAYILPKSSFPVLEEFCEGKRRDDMGSLIEHFLGNDVEVEGYYFSEEWHDVSHRSYLEALGEGELVKSDENSIVVHRGIGNLDFSITIVHPGKIVSRRAEAEKGVICFFAEGEGVFELEGEERAIRSKDVVPVLPGQSYQVHNTTDVDLVFLTTFLE